MKKFFLMLTVMFASLVASAQIVGTPFALSAAGGCAVEGAENYPQKFTFTGQWQSVNLSPCDFAADEYSKVVIEFAEPTGWDFNTPSKTSKGGDVAKWQAFNSLGTGKDSWEINVTEDIWDLWIQNSQTVTTTLTITKAYALTTEGEEVPIALTCGGGVSMSPVVPDPTSMKATLSQQWGGVHVSDDILGLIGKKTLRIYSNEPLTGVPMQWCIKTAEGKDAWPAIGVSDDPYYAECVIEDVLSSIYLQWTSTESGNIDIKAITWENEEPSDAPEVIEKKGDIDAFAYTVAREYNAGGDKTFGKDEVTVVNAPAKVTNDYESQFFIVFDKAYPAGTKLNVQFDGKASAAVSVGTQAHRMPGQYNHYQCIGNIDLTTEWQTYNKDLTISSDMGKDGGMQSIAFNLSVAEEMVYEFQNVSVTIADAPLAMGNYDFNIYESVAVNEYEGVTINFSNNNVAGVMAGEECLEYGALALIAKEAYLYEEGNDEPIAEEFFASDFVYGSTSMFTHAKLEVGKKYNVVIPIYGLQLINQMNDECYWTNTSAINMSFEVTPEVYVSNLVITEAGWATYSAPFAVDLNAAKIEGVSAYTVEGVEGDVLTLEEIKDGIIPAWQPVVLHGDACVAPFSGEEDPDAPWAGGLLETAGKEDINACVGDYVLQNIDGKVGFYSVEESETITIPAWKCFIPAKAGKAGVKALYLDAAATAINKLTSAEKKAQIFDVNGRQINKLQKGINIVNGVKILVK